MSTSFIDVRDDSQIWGERLTRPMAESIQEGVEELRESVRIDPRFARSHADIADALSQLISYGGGDRDGALLEEARAAAYTAIALAPDLAARAIALDGFDLSSLHAVGLAELFVGDFAAAEKAFGDRNRFHPASRWSYVKHAVALSLDGQCDKALEQDEKAEELMNNHPPTLQDSRLAWGYIEAARNADPELIDAGFGYLYALEGDSKNLVDLVVRAVESKDPITPFVGIFRADHVGWNVSAALSEDQRYQAILAELQFPAAD